MGISNFVDICLDEQLQIIVCSNGEAGVNFEHTGVDGHTVLRYAADIYTELVLLFAKVRYNMLGVLPD